VNETLDVKKSYVFPAAFVIFSCVLTLLLGSGELIKSCVLERKLHVPIYVCICSSHGHLVIQTSFYGCYDIRVCVLVSWYKYTLNVMREICMKHNNISILYTSHLITTLVVSSQPRSKRVNFFSHLQFCSSSLLLHIRWAY